MFTVAQKRIQKIQMELEAPNDQVEKKQGLVDGKKRFFEVLTNLFGDFVHIIDPDMSTSKSPVDTFDIVGAINYIQKIETIIREDGGILRKPIVAIWNTTTTNIKTSYDWHWQTCIILPVSYVKPDGTKLDNKEEIVYFRDSYFRNAKFPLLLKYLLQNELFRPNNMQQESDDQGSKNLSLGGGLKNAKYFELSNHGESFPYRDECKGMAVYDAFKFVVRGTDQWIKKQIGQLHGGKLSGQFQNQSIGLSDVSFLLKQLLHSQIQGLQLAQIEVQNDGQLYGWEPYYQIAYLERLKNQQKAFSQVLNMREHDLHIQQYPKMLKVQVGLTLPEFDGQYLDLIQKKVFVDKSIFIKEVIEAPAKAVLITRPRRWGKTLNMRMLNDFFQPEVDPLGNFDLAQGNKNRPLFKDLIIGQQRTDNGLNIIEHYQGQYPVIFLSLREVGGDTLESVINTLKSQVSQLYMKHDYVYRKQLITRIEDYEIKLEDNDKMLISSGYVTECKENKLQQIPNVNNKLGYVQKEGEQTIQDPKQGYQFYKIPNKEVYLYFKDKVFDYLLKQWQAKLPDVENFYKELTHKLDNSEKFMEFMNKEILPKLNSQHRNESGFHELIHGMYELALIFGYQTNHIIHSEYLTVNDKNIDCIFFPKAGKSNSVIIHEYKMLADKKDLKEKKILEGLSQLFSKCYIDAALSQYDVSNFKVRHWELIVTRAIIFYYDYPKKIWQMDLKERQFTLIEAMKVNKYFLNKLEHVQDIPNQTPILDLIEAISTDRIMIKEEHQQTQGNVIYINRLQQNNKQQVNQVPKKTQPKQVLQDNLIRKKNLRK